MIQHTTTQLLYVASIGSSDKKSFLLTGRNLEWDQIHVGGGGTRRQENMKTLI